MNAVGIRPTRGDFSLPDARIIKPGDVKLNPKVRGQTQTGRIAVKVEGETVAEVPVFVRTRKNTGQGKVRKLEIGKPEPVPGAPAIAGRHLGRKAPGESATLHWGC